MGKHLPRFMGYHGEVGWLRVEGAVAEPWKPLLDGPQVVIPGTEPIPL